jgi:hypothetical protein
MFLDVEREGAAPCNGLSVCCEDGGEPDTSHAVFGGINCGNIVWGVGYQGCNGNGGVGHGLKHGFLILQCALRQGSYPKTSITSCEHVLEGTEEKGGTMKGQGHTPELP